MNDFGSSQSRFADMAGSGHRAKFTSRCVICENLLAADGSADEQIVGPKPISIGAEVAGMRAALVAIGPIFNDIRV